MLLKSIIIGIKKSNSIQILPNRVLLIINNPISRILRVIGGISFILTISKSIILLTTNKIIILIIQISGIIFISYCLILNIYRVIRIFKIIKNKEYEVRNSPLDKKASLLSHIILNLRGICYIGGTILGIGLGLDEVLKESKRPAIFKPIAGTIVDKIFYNTGTPNLNILKSALDNVKDSTNNRLPSPSCGE
jgi:hypothetical protein